MNDDYFMRLAVQQAQLGLQADEVPVGAVLVHHGVVLAAGHNANRSLNDPTAHAEMVVLRAAAQKLNNYRLDDCALFVTLEPCAMCAGAMLHARLKRVVFGAADPKTGAAGSVLNLFAQPQLNHQTQLTSGVLAHDCAHTLQGFFQSKRQAQRAQAWPLREDALRTPEARFANLPNYPWSAHYIASLPGLEGLRLHYLDEVYPVQNGKVMLCLHGGAGWSYAFSPHIAGWLAQGYRVIAPDYIGFGKSDKPKRSQMHTLAFHTGYLLQLIEHLNLQHIVLALHGVGQELGQRLGAVLQAQAAERFAALPPIAVPDLTANALSEAERLAALEAPYPDSGHQAALRAFAIKKPTPSA